MLSFEHGTQRKTEKTRRNQALEEKKVAWVQKTLNTQNTVTLKK
jgi:hypothetical protein